MKEENAGEQYELFVHSLAWNYLHGSDASLICVVLSLDVVQMYKCILSAIWHVEEGISYVN